MKLRTKLFLGFGVIFLLFINFSGVVYQRMTVINKNVHQIVEEQYRQVKIADEFRNEINAVAREIQYLIQFASEKELAARAEGFERWKNEALRNLSELAQASQEEEARQLLNEIYLNFDEFMANTGMLARSFVDQRTEQVRPLVEKNDRLRVQLVDAVNRFAAYQEEKMESSFDDSTAHYRNAINFISLAVIGTLLLVVGVCVWVFRSLTDSLEKITAVMGNVAAGVGEKNGWDKLPRIPVQAQDEIGAIAGAYNRMAATIEAYHHYEVETAQNLKDQNWLKTTVADVTVSAQGIQDLHEYAHVVIRRLTPVLQAGFGVFYIKRQEGAEAWLEKVAEYAGSGTSGPAESRFAMGEGLVGECALQQQKLHMTGISGDKAHIRSGVVASKEVSLLLLPIVVERETVAVLEFASFSAFGALHLTLVEELVSTVGLTVHSIGRHMQIQRLLKESQVFTEELQTQSEELQLQQEELRTLNDQLEDQYRQSEIKTRELEQSKAELEATTAQMVIASQYKSEFMANVSHELRTPLNSLLILSQMLTENKEGNLTPKQLEFVRTIHSSGSDLLSLINDILDLAKIESGKMELAYEEVSIRELQESALRQFEPVAAHRRISFEVEAAEEMAGFRLTTDPLRLQQIITNLLSNAMKFTREGSVRMRIGLADPAELAQYSLLVREKHVLAISVRDTGIGISEEKLASIFEAFQQADGTTSRNFGGTGLGLSISKEIAAMLGGFITVNSRVGEGSIFTLYVPVRDLRGQSGLLVEESHSLYLREAAPALENEELPLPVGEPVREDLAGKRVLLVDDDMRNIYALTTVLETHGLDVRFAENGEEALELLRESPDVDIVLMDIMMPKLDGYETLRRIRAIDGLETLPVIALTAKAMKDDREKCIEAGASDYISKPIQVEQLLSLMRVWLHRSDRAR